MSTLYTNAKLVNPAADAVTTGWLLVEGGMIAGTGTGPAPTADAVIDCGGKYLAPGIIDLGVKVCEPGERHKESFRSAGRAAAIGGVTTMVTRPDTDPVIDTPEILEFVHRRAVDAAAVRVVSMAALTKGRQGGEMTEIGFLQDAGAVAFTDCDRPVQNPKVFQRCLTYANGLDALVIGHAQEPTLSKGACVTSGPFATKLGLTGVSPMAERMQLERDLAIVEMTGARYHLDQLSCEASLKVLARARAEGLRVSAGASAHHLTLNEFDVADYRTFFKIKPPLRAEEDRLALIRAVQDGLVEVICSMHTPQDEESKRLPYEEAASGAVGLETLLPAALQLYHAEYLDLPQLFRCLTLNPANLLGLPQGRMEIGAPADLILFDPDMPFVMDRKTLASKSKNTPYDGRRMQGRVLRTFVGGNEVFAR